MDFWMILLLIDRYKSLIPANAAYISKACLEKDIKRAENGMIE